MLAHHADEEPLWISRSKQEESKQLQYEPKYFAQDPGMLSTTATVHSFMVGTGASIFEQAQVSLDSVEAELVVVTCFWAASPSLNVLANALRRLSDKAQASGTRKIKVFIGLSSLSWKQKILQTSKQHGRLYSPCEWPAALGLPSCSDLPGLELTIKSIFVKPFSVMHPKFVIIDRKLVWLPSCNVSWETWFEGAVVLSGDVVASFVHFWQDFWLHGQGIWPAVKTSSTPIVPELAVSSPTLILDNRAQTYGRMNVIFLPCPHHPYQLCLPFIPSKSAKLPPPSPLTIYLRTQIQVAQKSIFIQTPNITAYVVLHELLSALEKGVDVSITTSARLMVLEQLVTAGTTTSSCLEWLIMRYKQILLARARDLEANIHIGRLQIWYFEPCPDSAPNEAKQSHLKLTIFDDEVTLLGSHNMDRASWFTSQELGLAFISKQFAENVKATLAQGMHERRTCLYDSEPQSD